MKNKELGKIISKMGTNVEGQAGYWTFEFEGVFMVCVTDERADRMRIMTPIASIEDISPEQLTECMEANFDRALDARYCMDAENLWGAFIHPLKDLSGRLVFSALHQVAGVRHSFGTSYSSGIFQFGGGKSQGLDS